MKYNLDQWNKKIFQETYPPKNYKKQIKLASKYLEGPTYEWCMWFYAKS